MQDLALFDDWRIVSDKQHALQFSDFATQSNVGLLRIDQQLRRHIRHPETLTLLTKAKLEGMFGFGRRRISCILEVLGAHGWSLLPNIESFPGRFLALYGSDLSEEVPIEALELMTWRGINDRTAVDRTVRDAHTMMRIMPLPFYKLAASVGIHPAEGPLCQNGLFVHDVSQQLWDTVIQPPIRRRTHSIYSFV